MNKLNQMNEKQNKQGLPPKSVAKRILCFYFVMPFFIGMVLGNWIGNDVSSVIVKHIGVFRFLAGAGIDMHTKSVIFIMYLVFSPCVWFYLVECKKLQPNGQFPFKTKSSLRILILMVGLLIMFLVFVVIILIGPNQGAMVTPNRSIRILLSCSKWDISFAMFFGGQIFAASFCFFGASIFANELILRIKN